MNVHRDLPRIATRVVATKQGKKSHGTGFFMHLEYNKLETYAIVTNRHVVSGSDFIDFECKAKSDDESKPLFDVNYTIEDPHSIIVFHPNPEIDLALILLNDIISDLYEKKINLKIIFLTESNILKDEMLPNLKAIEDVIMIGCPRALWDEHNKIPIARSGVTATPIFLNFQNRPEFLIDIAVFQGSSGSPVLICRSEVLRDADNSTVIANYEVTLVGIFYAGAKYKIRKSITDFSFEMSLEKENSEVTDATVIVEIPMNIGYCINAKEIKMLKENWYKAALRELEI